MSWSEEAWHSIGPILDEIRNHPFVKELADGTLPKEKFATYLAQDRIYLANYGQEMRDLASMLPDGPMQDLYRKFAQESIDSENALHEQLGEMGFDSIDTEPLAGTTGYMRHTSGIIAEKDLAVSMAAILPCMWVYNEVGKYILGIASLEGNPYRAWIECYTSQIMAEESTPQKRESMTSAFVESVRFELKFWDQAYKNQ